MSEPSTHRPCGDCGAQPGQPHTPGCDVARCLYTGMQRIACDSGAWRAYGPEEEGDEQPDDFHEDCGEDVWAGEWPGDEDCRRLGLWCYWEDGRGWVECAPDHPKATEDLNRLRPPFAAWDRDARRWEAVSR